MKPSRFFYGIGLAAALVLLVACAYADSSSQNAIYQTSFATSPQWTTNNPSSDYWDPGNQTYHFSIEPSTGNYAYSPDINYNGGSFTLEYDVHLDSIDDGATFRLGFSGKEMDFNKGPNIMTGFTSGKYGQIMELHVVTQSAKMIEATSYTESYGGPTVRFDTNTTYHVRVDYNDDTDVVTETVSNKATGAQVWSYYVSSQESLKLMNRIYIGSVGDYGTMNLYAKGWIDNVALTVPAPAATLTPTTPPVSTMPTYSLRPTTKSTTVAPLTSIPTPAKKSPVSEVTSVIALGLTGLCSIWLAHRRK